MSAGAIIMGGDISYRYGDEDIVGLSDLSSLDLVDSLTLCLIGIRA